MSCRLDCPFWLVKDFDRVLWLIKELDLYAKQALESLSYVNSLADQARKDQRLPRASHSEYIWITSCYKRYFAKQWIYFYSWNQHLDICDLYIRGYFLPIKWGWFDNSILLHQPNKAMVLEFRSDLNIEMRGVFFWILLPRISAQARSWGRGMFTKCPSFFKGDTEIWALQFQ